MEEGVEHYDHVSENLMTNRFLLSWLVFTKERSELLPNLSLTERLDADEGRLSVNPSDTVPDFFTTCNAI